MSVNESETGLRSELNNLNYYFFPWYIFGLGQTIANSKTTPGERIWS